MALAPNSALVYIPLAWALNSVWKPAEALVAVDNSIRFVWSTVFLFIVRLAFCGP